MLVKVWRLVDGYKVTVYLSGNLSDEYRVKNLKVNSGYYNMKVDTRYFDGVKEAMFDAAEDTFYIYTTLR